MIQPSRHFVWIRNNDVVLQIDLAYFN